MNEKERMLYGGFYHPVDEQLGAERLRARSLTMRYNALPPGAWDEHAKILEELLGHAGYDCWFEPPFHCDYGYNIAVGDGFYANFNCTLLDCAKIQIGSHVMFGPNVVIAAATHPLLPEQRNSGFEFGRPVTIGNNVWLGAGVVVNPGVTIGDNAVIGSGSVVTKDIPPDVLAVGIPCRVLRPITEADRMEMGRP